MQDLDGNQSIISLHNVVSITKLPFVTRRVSIAVIIESYFAFASIYTRFYQPMLNILLDCHQDKLTIIYATTQNVLSSAADLAQWQQHSEHAAKAMPSP